MSGVVDLFAGPGGWDEGLRMLGVTDVVGVESDTDACTTARVAGHQRVRGDVSALRPSAFAGARGVIGSPQGDGEEITIYFEEEHRG